MFILYVSSYFAIFPSRNLDNDSSVTSSLLFTTKALGACNSHLLVVHHGQCSPRGHLPHRVVLYSDHRHVDNTLQISNLSLEFSWRHLIALHLLHKVAEHLYLDLVTISDQYCQTMKVYTRARAIYRLQ